MRRIKGAPEAPNTNSIQTRRGPLGGIVTAALAGLELRRLFSMMSKVSYAGYRFPPEIIQQAIWLYVRFTLSFRDVEDLLAERGISVAADLRKRRPKPHATWHLDEVYLKIDGRMVYL